MRFNELTIKKAEELTFGTAPFPVETPRGLIIGGGEVYPELNFTLPTMTVNKETFPTVKEHYRGNFIMANQRQLLHKYAVFSAVTT